MAHKVSTIVVVPLRYGNTEHDLRLHYYVHTSLTHLNHVYITIVIYYITIKIISKSTVQNMSSFHLPLIRQYL